jgi:hypothetical protein
MDRRNFAISGVVAGTIFAAGDSQADDAVAHAPKRFAAALNASDVKAFAALFAEDYLNHQISAAAPPLAGVTGKQATVAFSHIAWTRSPA